MASFLHTMVRITEPERSRAFYEALGFRFSRDMDIVRDGEARGDELLLLDRRPGERARADVQPRRSHATTSARATATSPSESTTSTRRSPRSQDEHGIEPERPPYQVREGGSRICFVRDPDDYRIELIERGD